MKTAVDYFPPVMFSAIRFTLGAIVLLGFCLYKKIPLPKKGDWKWYALCGLLQTAYVFTVNQQALLHLDAGITSLISFTMPFWFAILAHFTINERLTITKITALILGIIGLFFVLEVNPLQLKMDGVLLVTQLLVLTGSFAWATANIIVKKVLQENNKLQFTTYQMAIGAVALFAYSLVFEQGQTIYWTPIAVMSLLFAGIVASAFAFFLWFFLLERGEGGKASLSLLLVPVIGVICGWLFLGETVHLSVVLGIILIVSGIGLVNLQDDHPLQLFLRRKSSKAKDTA